MELEVEESVRHWANFINSKIFRLRKIP
jgi:hypothetical protein